MSRLFSLFLMVGVFSLLAACDKLPFPERAANDVIFSDAFTPGEGGRWRIEGDELASSSLTGDKLVISVSEPQTVQYATLDGEHFTDFVLEVDASLLAGDPSNSYGILFRVSGPAQFYRFELTGNGFYAVERHDGVGIWTRLTSNWEESSAINQGLGATNRLQVSALGESLRFAINDQVVTELSDLGYGQGTIGLDAGTFSHPNVRVSFDNLIVLRP